MSEVSTASATFSGGAEAYEQLMGRWSRRLAGPFIDFLGVRDGDTVLDVGCGTGSLTLAVAARAKVPAVTGIDLLRGLYRLCPRPHRRQADHLRHRGCLRAAYPDDGFDRVASMLVLNFVPDAAAAAAEMVRVARPGGTVAAAIWDLRGGFPMFRMFWDTAAVQDAEAASARAGYFSAPFTRPGELARAWTGFGLGDVVQDCVTIRMDFDSFDDYWRPLTGKTGPAGTYLATLPTAQRSTLKTRLRAAYEAGDPDGPRSFASTAWVCRGRLPE